MSEIIMPRLSDTMEDGVIATWTKQAGETVAEGDVLAEIETDKAIMELEADEAGVLTRILVEPGVRVPIGTPIGVINDGTGASTGSAIEAKSTSSAEPTAKPAADPAGKPAATATGAPAVTEPARPAGPAEPDQRFKASPLARRLARERGIDLSSIQGTGPGGRITRVDIEAASAAPLPVESPAPAARTSTDLDSADPDVEDVPLTRVQRIAAERLTKAKQDAPHIYLTSAVDVTELLAFRAQLNAALGDGHKVSVNDLVVKAAASALRAHPDINVSFAGDRLRRHRKIHVGIAVATPAGLMVPVIHEADGKSVAQIAAESREKAARARDGKLHLDDITGATFTVSNLGMYGVEQFCAVVNPPEAAILAVGAATEEVRPRNGELVVRSILRITLSCDHRAVDGATGAAFLRDLTALLESPLRVIA